MKKILSILITVMITAAVICGCSVSGKKKYPSPTDKFFVNDFADVIDDGITGYGYEFDNLDALKKLLVKIANNPNMINSLRVNCLEKVEYYSTEHLLNYLKLI